MTDTSVRPDEAPAPPDPSEPRGEIVGWDWKLFAMLGALVALGVFAGVGWLVMVVAILVMIFLHELGHFLTAKWSGMKVTEFFLFFGPKIWSFKRGETEYGIKCIPAGAYVRIIGMSNIETDIPPEDEHRTYRQQSYPKRLLVVCAGSIMHVFQALVLFFLAFAVVGVPGGGGWAEDIGGPVPDDEAWIVGAVTADSGAEAAGIQPGDDVISIGGTPIATFDDVGGAVRPNAGETVDVVVVRDGEELTFEATLGENPNHEGRGFLGIGETYEELPTYRAGPVTAARESVEAVVDVSALTVGGLAKFFSGGVDDLAVNVAEGGSESAPPEASGSGEPAPISEEDANRPMSIFGVARFGAGVFDQGIAGFLVLMAVVNLSIGLLNMIPLLPLDGGHAAIATYERLRSIGGRRHMVDVSRLLPFTYAVFMFMVLLGMSTIYLDIVDPIG